MGGIVQSTGSVRTGRDGCFHPDSLFRSVLRLEEGGSEMGVITKQLPVYAEKIPGGAVVTTSLEKILHHSQACSLWYLLFGTACCAIELMATGASRYDFDRLGMIF